MNSHEDFRPITMRLSWKSGPEGHFQAEVLHKSIHQEQRVMRACCKLGENALAVAGLIAVVVC